MLLKKRIWVLVFGFMYLVLVGAMDKSYNTILQLSKCIQFGKICENEGELKNPFKITLPSCANVKKTSVRQAKNVKRD